MDSIPGLHGARQRAKPLGRRARLNIFRSEGIRTILLELTETAKPKDSDFAADGDNLQRAGACVRACELQGAGNWLLRCVRGASGAGNSDSKLKVQTIN